MKLVIKKQVITLLFGFITLGTLGALVYVAKTFTEVVMYGIVITAIAWLFGVIGVSCIGHSNSKFGKYCKKLSGEETENG